MIRVTVELIPGGIGTPVKIGEMTIANNVIQTKDTDGFYGSYTYRLFGKRRRILKDNGSGLVENFPRQHKNVWHLVGWCLQEAGYASRLR